MRSWYSLLFTVTLTVGTTSADQTDPHLNELFDVLQRTTDLNSIRDTENAIWEIWLQHENQDVMRLMEMGTQRMNYQRFNDALLIFSQIIEKYPEFAEAWNKRATLYYIVGDLEASLADIEKTLALEPRHFGALSGLGLVYVQRNELSRAKETFEKLISIHPHSPNAAENLRQVEASQSANII